MRKFVGLAIIALFAATSAAQAQRGGGSHGGGSHGGGGVGGAMGGFHGGGGFHGNPGFGPTTGGFRPGFRGHQGFFRPGFRSFGYGYGYGFGAYPTSYIGYSGFRDYPNFDGYYSAPMQYAPQLPPAAPVVINQYYSPQVSHPVVHDYSAGVYGDNVQTPVPRPEAAAATKPEYWLIALTDGTVALAIAFWTTGNTLHYVTRSKDQRQLPLSAIDRELTAQLNPGGTGSILLRALSPAP